MLRTITTCEKNVDVIPADAITVPATTSTEVVPDTTNVALEKAAITIQNCSASDLYYAFGQTCDNVKNFHGILPAKSQLVVPVTKSVSVYSAAGATVAVCIFKRTGGL